MGLSVPFYEYYRNNCFYTQIFMKNTSISMFEILQGINPIELCASLDDYKTKYFTNMKICEDFA